MLVHSPGPQSFIFYRPGLQKYSQALVKAYKPGLHGKAKPYSFPQTLDGIDIKLLLYLYLNWQNVLGTHHAIAHGGLSDLIVKMLD